MAFLLDTNVVSELRKPRPQAAVLSWFDAAPAEDLFLSVLVLGEIEQGVARLRERDPAQSAAHGRWLGRLRRDFADRLLDVELLHGHLSKGVMERICRQRTGLFCCRRGSRLSQQ